MNKLFIFLVFSVVLGVASVGHAVEYKIDNSHSMIGFTVKHLGISTVRGSFGDYVGTIDIDAEAPAAFKADVVIQTASIDTNHEGRDNHLKGADFFDVEKFPTISFKGEALVKTADGYQIAGLLKIRDVEKRIYIPIEIAGPVDNPYGGKAIGIKGSTVINRQDYGVSWNKTLDSGGLAVSDDVTLVIELEGHAE